MRWQWQWQWQWRQWQAVGTGSQKRVLFRTATVNGTHAHAQVPRAHMCGQGIDDAEWAKTNHSSAPGQSLLVHRRADKARRPGRNVPFQSGKGAKKKLKIEN